VRGYKYQCNITHSIHSKTSYHRVKSSQKSKKVKKEKNYKNVIKTKTLKIKEKKAKMVKEFNKSLSNTSTTSVESGIFDIDFIPDDEFEVESIGETVKKVLCEAQEESRLICGWKDAIRYLNETDFPEHSLFFCHVPCSKDDSIAHIQEVMMKAFCLDHDIYVIQLDSEEKLNKLLGGSAKESHKCALVQRSSSLKCQNADDEIDLDEFSQLENLLIDHCEEFWYDQIQPIVRLPEK
jgi:hypothetical protein